MRWNVIEIDHRHPRHPLLQVVVLAIVCIVRVLRSQPIDLVLSFVASMPSYHMVSWVRYLPCYLWTACACRVPDVSFCVGTSERKSHEVQ